MEGNTAELVAEDFTALYPALIEHVKRRGIPFRPRGFKCLECRPLSFTILDASKAVYTGANRKLNYRFYAIESLGYIAGIGGEAGEEWFAELLCRVNPRMSSFVNPATKLFDGAYGNRLKRSLGAICELLKHDPDIRQAVASIWSPGPFGASLDVPCTVMFHFMRANSTDYTLDLTVYMRSNDLNWGTPYDVAAFCTVLSAVAGAIGWQVGKYTHVAGSLHLYEESMPNFSPSLDVVKRPELLSPIPTPTECTTFDLLRGETTSFLQRVHRHILVEKKPWSEYRESLDTREWLQPWFDQWSEVLRTKFLGE